MHTGDELSGFSNMPMPLTATGAASPYNARGLLQNEITSSNGQYPRLGTMGVPSEQDR